MNFQEELKKIANEANQFHALKYVKDMLREAAKNGDYYLDIDDDIATYDIRGQLKNEGLRTEDINCSETRFIWD